ncbi:MAG: NUDIX domain-containing protein [Flavobacteriales bacterium]
MKFLVEDAVQAYQGFLKIIQAKVTFDSFESGKSIMAKREMMDRGDSVAVLLFEKDTQNFLLTRQFRFPAATKDQHDKIPNAGWLDEIPAGKLEDGENPHDCAKREVMEELGYRCESLQSISHFYVSPGGTSERIWLFYSEVQSSDKIGDGGGLDSEHENIQLMRYHKDDLAIRIANGEIRDAKTIIAIQWWKLHH